MESLDNLELLMADIRIDAQKFYENGNKAAGTRLRVALQKLKNEAQGIRINVLELSKG